jgi:hypothetical protein
MLKMTNLLWKGRRGRWCAQVLWLTKVAPTSKEFEKRSIILAGFAQSFRLMRMLHLQSSVSCFHFASHSSFVIVLTHGMLILNIRIEVIRSYGYYRQSPTADEVCSSTWSAWRLIALYSKDHDLGKGWVISVGLSRWCSNITVTILDIHCRVFYLKLNSTQLCRFDHTSGERHYVSATSPTGLVGSWRWYINIAITVLGIIHRPDRGDRQAVTTRPNWVGFTWRRGQNPVSEMSCFKWNTGRWIYDSYAKDECLDWMLCLRITTSGGLLANSVLNLRIATVAGFVTHFE